MAKNPDYWHQIRARGLCTLCRLPMPDDDPKLAHRACYQLQWQGRTIAEIQVLARKAQEEAGYGHGV
jgi:hypothetical protein